MGQAAVPCAPHRDRTALVKAHVYNFRPAPTADLAGSTSYQVTLEIHGKEYSYRSSDGIFSRPAGECPEREYKEAVRLGRTETTSRQLEVIIKDLSASYTSSQFSTLNMNSGHFCSDLCLRLGVEPVPAPFMRLAAKGASTDEHVAKVTTDARSAVAAVAAKAGEIEVVGQARDTAAAHVQSFKAKAEELDAKALDTKLGVSATTAGLAAKAADAKDSIRKARKIGGG